MSSIPAVRPHPNDEPTASIHSNPLAIAAWASALVIFLLNIPSLTIVVFLRRKFGCRFIKLWMVVLAALLLWTVYSVQALFSLRPTPARVFALAMLTLALVHSRQAWKRFWLSAVEHDKLWHSESEGIPWLHTLLPWLDERILKIVLEPAIAGMGALACLFMGALLARFSVTYSPYPWMMLGLWLALAAISHALFEYMLYEQRLHQWIDFVDGNIESASMMELQQSFARGGRTHAPTAEEALGNPVIYNPDMFKVMEAARSRAELAKAAAIEPTAPAYTASAAASLPRADLARPSTPPPFDKAKAKPLLLAVAFLLPVLAVAAYLLLRTPRAANAEATPTISAVDAETLAVGGSWQGRIEQTDGTRWSADLQLEQNGNQLYGTLLKQSARPSRYAKVTVSGSVQGGTIQLAETTFMQQSGASCLVPLFTLRHVVNQTFAARWQPHGRCPGGYMEVTRQ